MTTFEGALVREQGMTFGIAVVKRSAINNLAVRDQIVAEASRVFGGVPTILMAQRGGGKVEYYGRSDIVRFMEAVPASAVPWKRYTY